MTTTRDQYFIQKNYGGIWINFGEVYPDLKTAKYRIKDLKGEFRIFKRQLRADWLNR